MQETRKKIYGIIYLVGNELFPTCSNYFSYEEFLDKCSSLIESGAIIKYKNPNLTERQQDIFADLTDPKGKRQITQSKLKEIIEELKQAGQEGERK